MILSTIEGTDRTVVLCFARSLESSMGVELGKSRAIFRALKENTPREHGLGPIVALPRAASQPLRLVFCGARTQCL